MKSAFFIALKKHSIVAPLLDIFIDVAAPTQLKLTTGKKRNNQRNQWRKPIIRREKQRRIIGFFIAISNRTADIRRN